MYFLTWARSKVTVRVIGVQLASYPNNGHDWFTCLLRLDRSNCVGFRCLYKVITMIQMLDVLCYLEVTVWVLGV